jgi:hypothetical protein
LLSVCLAACKSGPAANSNKEISDPNASFSRAGARSVPTGTQGHEESR